MINTDYKNPVLTPVFQQQTKAGCCAKIKQVFKKIINFLAELFKKCFCISSVRPLKPIPKEIDDYWNKVVQFHIGEGFTAQGHYFADQLALACKLDGMKQCRFEKIFAKASGGAAHCWFTREQTEGYGERSREARRGDFNSPTTLCLSEWKYFEDKVPKEERERLQQEGRTDYPYLNQAEFYSLSRSDVNLIQMRRLPTHLKKFLLERP